MRSAGKGFYRWAAVNNCQGFANWTDNIPEVEMMRLRRFLIIGLGVVIGVGSWIAGVHALATNDYVLFLQTKDGQRTLYITNENGSNLKSLATGKNITVYSINQHLVFYNQYQLFEYSMDSQAPKLLHRFNGGEDLLYAFSMKPAGPDQALVVTGNEYSSFLHWYVLEFSDGSLRKINPPYNSLPPGKPEFLSPDDNGEASIKRITFDYRYELTVKEKLSGKFKTIWTLPKNRTVLPARPVWAPNSRLVAFYAKEFQTGDDLRGAYSLYVFNLNSKTLIPVQDQVFSIANYTSKIEMGEFTPDWSSDGSYLIAEYQPFGLPTESSVLKYEVQSGRKIYLNDSKGDKQYPTWSPSNQSIFFFSSRDGDGIQLYVMGADGTGLKRLSPAGGVTEWAEWHQF
jgi:hypothetical protein